MDATITFYRLVGLDIRDVPGTWPPGSGGRHAGAPSPNRALIEVDNTELAQIWGHVGLKPGSTVIGFSFSSRSDVDDTYNELIGAGYTGVLEPYDAFFGARYAIVHDPDGHPVGLMSPIEPGRRFTPDVTANPETS